MKYYYLLPKRDFFKRGYRGSVVHALGIMNGFSENSIGLTAIHYGGLENFTKDQPQISLKGKFMSFTSILKIVGNADSRLLIRYSISNAFLIYVISLFAKNSSVICLEVNTVHTMYKPEGIVNKSIGVIEAFVLKRIKNIYVVSSGASDFLVNKYDLKKENICVLPNALINVKDAESKNVVNDFNFPRLVYLGSLHGYYDIIQICEWVNEYNKAHNPSIEFHIYGNDDSDGISSLKEKFGSQIVFHGSYDNKLVASLIANDDILVLPYKEGTIAEYGSPTKLFEYMSLKAPILSSSVGQLSDIIQHKTNGLLYSGKESFFENLQLLLNDPFLRKETSENAFNEVKNKHTWQMRIKDLIKFWQ